jgi:DHA3 family multidrug efflux protein-like MFS transporter
VKTFRQLVANSLIASFTNNFVWFALTFWLYLETQSVVATAVIGGAYMLLTAASGLAWGTYVDRHRRKTSMFVSSVLSLGAFAAAAVLWVLAPDGSLSDLSHPACWAFLGLILAGAIAGNLRIVALSTAVTLLVPEDEHDRANGLVGVVNGVGFALTSVFSGVAVGQLGMGWAVFISVGFSVVVLAHLLTIAVEEDEPAAVADGAPAVDFAGALKAVRLVDGLLAVLFFATFNNFLGGVFMALVDPYGLELVSVETWGFLWGGISFGFIAGGLLVSRRGLGASPPRTLLLVNTLLWVICIVFPLRPWVWLLTLGLFAYMVLVPIVEACEQTIIQRVVPFAEQGRVFGFSQTLETAASPVASFVIGPVAQVWVIPFMTTGAGVESIGPWFGVGPDRGMALVFILAGLIGLAVTLYARRSRAFRDLATRYAAGPAEVEVEGDAQTVG